MKICWKKLTGIYLITFGVIMLMYNSLNLSVPYGEWDDYSLPIASIMNRNSLSISDSDIETYKEIFPEWSEKIDSYILSPYTTKKGEQMPWYFPVYGVVCIPFTLLLRTMGLPSIYAFPYTNIALLMVALIIVWKCLHVGEKKKMMLIALLSVNPIVFYIGWASAEVFIYSALIVAFVSWYNRWYKRAALFVSVAGMLNPTIMSIGFVMIGEYLFGLVKNKSRETSWKNFFKDVWLKVFAYGCCYIIGLVPMAYNLYHTGHINLTASLSSFTKGTETTLQRFVSYLLDLNYGVLPYFAFVFIIALYLCACAIFHKKWKYLEWVITFIINVYLYSIMIHINHGMSGIARYNVWGVVPLLFAVGLFFDQILDSRKIINSLKVLLMAGICITGAIVFKYDPYTSSNAHVLSFTPIAKWVLDNMPQLYNPLHSTFYSRTCAIDNGYDYECALPIVYYDDDMCARKILLDSSDTDTLKYELNGTPEDIAWLDAKLDKVTDLCYLSVGSGHSLKAAEIVCLETIWLSGEEYNVEDYMITGISSNELTHTWTEGNKVDFSFNSSDLQAGDSYYIHIYVAGLVNDSQQVILSCNGEEIYNDILYGASEIIASFSTVDNESPSFSMFLPDAISPKELGTEDDVRTLALSLTSITCEKKLSYIE